MMSRDSTHIVHAMVTSVMNIGEYDRRVVLITREIGRVAAFARGARRPKSSLLGATRPFVTGLFTLYQGRDSYTIKEVDVRDYFSSLSLDLDKTYYGLYMLEVANFYTRENNDESEVLRLLYATLRAMQEGRLSLPLIRAIFELKMLCVQGEYPYLATYMDTGEPVGDQPVYHFGISQNGLLSQGGIMLQKAVILAMDYVICASMEKTFSFAVKPVIEEQFCDVVGRYFIQKTQQEFSSLKALKWLEYMPKSRNGEEEAT